MKKLADLLDQWWQAKMALENAEPEDRLAIKQRYEQINTVLAEWLGCGRPGKHSPHKDEM